MTGDLLGLYREFVRVVLRGADRIVERGGLDGGVLDRLVDWGLSDGEVALAAVVAAVVLGAWAAVAGWCFSWVDLRVRARVEGRMGPRHRGLGGLSQGWWDWLKLMARKAPDLPSVAPAALAGALVLGAIAVLPVGGFLTLADPAWGVPVAAALLALAPLPLAATLRSSGRREQVASAAASGAVLMLAVAVPVMVADAGSSRALVDFQSDHGPFAALVPVAFALFMVAWWYEAGRHASLRAPGPASPPGPRLALARYTVYARHYALAMLGSIAFLGGWAGPLAEGSWWTLAKAVVLASVVSFASAAVQHGTGAPLSRDLRARWLPLAAVNLLVIALVLEVIA